MIYIVCAFEVEGRALIDNYKLSKKKSGGYSLFSNEEILLFICGMGQEKARIAIKHLLLNFPPREEDLFINLGICAAQEHFEIGALLQVKELCNQEESYKLHTINSKLQTVSCFSSKIPLSEPSNEDISEMEALSLYTSVCIHFKPEHISFLKIVSDHFNPMKLSKQFVITLIHQNLIPILNHIKQMKDKK